MQLNYEGDEYVAVLRWRPMIATISLPSDVMWPIYSVKSSSVCPELDQSQVYNSLKHISYHISSPRTS